MLKVGDKVKIKSCAKIEEEIDHIGSSPGFYPPMDEYCNKKAIITRMYFGKPHNAGGLQWIYLDVDDSRWVWSDNWVEKINVIQLDNKLFEL